MTNFRDVDEQVCWLGYKFKFVLTLRQLLQLDHFRYTICFIQAKIEVLDETTQSNDMGETIEPPPSTSTSTDESVTHVYLGSSKKATTVAEFASSSAEHGLTYPIFRKMLEDFLNNFYQAHQLPRERYLEIRSNQEVMSKILLVEALLIDGCFKDCGVSVPGNQL